MDETVHTSPNILCDKQLGSGERGVNVTTIAINAIGNHVPPIIILPVVHFKEHVLLGTPPDSIGGAYPSG